MRRRIVAGNWKLHGDRAFAHALLDEIVAAPTSGAVELVVLPPLPYLSELAEDYPTIAFGAQDVSANVQGAFTGEVCASMLLDVGARYGLVGHSERRQYHHEDDATINAKLKAAYRHELTPILCVGETDEIREEGHYVPHCRGQLDAALDGVTAEQAAGTVIAYEPIWAIGTGKVATPSDAQEVCAAIRSHLADRYSPELAAGLRILYGGSVKAANAADIVKERDIDGALVGGASLDGTEFATIVLAARPS